MKNYSTNITDNQWQFIKNTLNFNDRKRKYNLRTIWNAIMYLVKTGVTTFEWTKYLRPYAVTLKNGKTKKNLQFRFQA